MKAPHAKSQGVVCAKQEMAPLVWKPTEIPANLEREPEPVLLRALIFLEKFLRVLFYVSDGFVAFVFVWHVASSAGSSDPPDSLNKAMWYSAFPICCVQLLLTGAVLMFAAFPSYQAILAFANFTKRPGFLQSAGPWDPVGLGMRDFTKPHRAGLGCHSRQIYMPTADGKRLGGWHILPAGPLARAASCRVASGESIDDVFDEALRGDGDDAHGGGAHTEPLGGALGGARVCIYFHGMGETRCKWVS